MMFESAINCRRAFISLTFNDRVISFAQPNEEWEKEEKMCAFLAILLT